MHEIQKHIILLTPFKKNYFHPASIRRAPKWTAISEHLIRRSAAFQRGFPLCAPLNARVHIIKNKHSVLRLKHSTQPFREQVDKLTLF